jgi:hypothetical protein
MADFTPWPWIGPGLQTVLGKKGRTVVWCQAAGRRFALRTFSTPPHGAAGTAGIFSLSFVDPYPGPVSHLKEHIYPPVPYMGFVNATVTSRKGREFGIQSQSDDLPHLQQTVITRLWVGTQHRRWPLQVLRVRESMDSQMQDAKLIKWLLPESSFRGILAK